MDDSREKLTDFVEQLRILHASDSPIDSALLQFVIDGFDRFLSGKVRSLDVVFPVKPLPARRGRPIVADNYRKVCAELVYLHLSREVPLPLNDRNVIAATFGIDEKTVAHLWTLIVEALDEKSVSDLLSRRGRPIPPEAWESIKNGIAEGMCRSLSDDDEREKRERIAQVEEQMKADQIRRESD